MTNEIDQTTFDPFEELFLEDEDLFDSIKKGKPVNLPKVKSEPKEQFHCNLKKTQWAYHGKLTKLSANFNRQGIKQNQADQELIR